VFDSLPRWAASLFWRLWYPVLTALTRDAPVAFLNYGYDGDATRPLLRPEDEPDRPCIQLYDRVAHGGGGVDLTGLRVLEVSCGHGGGASYVARYLRPASVHGVDRNPRAVALCRRLHRGVQNLSFSRGDALALEFADGSFDAVLNVEASHCYRDMPRFLGEARRVLRLGGHLLYADFRRRDPEYEDLRRQVAASGFEVVRAEDISRQALSGMRLNTPKYLGLVRRLAPGFLRRPLMNFAGVTGSAMYRSLESGETVYFLYALRKPLAAEVV
jgi:SAM-dependent methyltransferase